MVPEDVSELLTYKWLPDIHGHVLMPTVRGGEGVCVCVAR